MTTNDGIMTMPQTTAPVEHPTSNLFLGAKRKLDDDGHHPTSSHMDGEDPMALLPRYTRVEIRGNNRTKITLIGQQAVVKRAVGLGGWHWLTLENGDEIKLQRNALTVLEYPTGHEHESSASEEDEQHHHPHSPYNRPSPRPEHAKPISPFREHKRVHRPAIPFTAEEYNGQRRAVASPRHPVTPTRVNFDKLGNSSLRRYGDFYRLPDAQAPRAELVTAVADHFSEQEIDEVQVIAHFLAAARRHAMGLPRTG